MAANTWSVSIEKKNDLKLFLYPLLLYSTLVQRPHLSNYGNISVLSLGQLVPIIMLRSPFYTRDYTLYCPLK